MWALERIKWRVKCCKGEGGVEERHRRKALGNRDWIHLAVQRYAGRRVEPGLRMQAEIRQQEHQWKPKEFRPPSLGNVEPLNIAHQRNDVINLEILCRVQTRSQSQDQVYWKRCESPIWVITWHFFKWIYSLNLLFHVYLASCEETFWV